MNRDRKERYEDQASAISGKLRNRIALLESYRIDVEMLEQEVSQMRDELGVVNAVLYDINNEETL